MSTKICRDCKLEKDITEFHNHVSMADGHVNKCKSCVCARVRKHRAKNDSVREYDRQRSKLPHRIQANIERCQRDRKRWPEKYKARTAVGNAVRDGKLIKPSNCLKCLKPGYITAHHKDYAKPLEVDWFCARCHALLEFSVLS